MGLLDSLGERKELSQEEALYQSKLEEIQQFIHAAMSASPKNPFEEDPLDFRSVGFGSAFSTTERAFNFRESLL